MEPGSDESEDSTEFQGELIDSNRPSTILASTSYITNSPTQSKVAPSGSFVVQPILISSPPVSLSSNPRAPPSLIPISSFSNQLRAQHVVDGIQFTPTTSSFVSPVQYIRPQDYEGTEDIDEEEYADEDEGDCDEESRETHDQYHLNDSRGVGKFGNSEMRSYLPKSSSPLVSTSSHSVVSGVKLHIHRAPVNQPTTIQGNQGPRNLNFAGMTKPASSDSEEEVVIESNRIQPKQSFSSNNSALDCLLSAIRSNTSLTIEEVHTNPTEPSQPSSRFGYHSPGPNHEYNALTTGGNGGEKNSDKVEVFVVPQQLTPPFIDPRKVETGDLQVLSAGLRAMGTVVKMPSKRGRPKRNSIVIPDEISTIGTNEDNLDSPSRRTGRSRKPTKHFMPDISLFRGHRKRASDFESKDTPVPVPIIAPPVPEDKVDVERSSEVEHVPKKRGRPSTGRPRGRPRGYSTKTKLTRDTPSALVEIADNKNSDPILTPSTQIPTTSNETSETTATTIVATPRRRNRIGVVTKGSRRGGARGGKRITKAQKIQKAKLKKLLSNRKDSLQLFEEETRMSADIKTLVAIPQVIEGEDASNSTSTSATTKLKKQSKVDIDERRPVTAETLFEYHWPVDDPLAEIFFLQEQVSEYLGVKSFKRKYPDLNRRIVDMAERDFLRDHKIVSETQCDLGLTALYSSDVLEIMFNDFPDRYEEYRLVVQERRDREFVKQKSAQTAVPVPRDKGAEFMRRILNSVTTWNSKLNKERNEQRSCSFDLQSFTLNIQKSKMRVLPPSATKTSYYPVSVLPGQFVDSYKRYSSTELKYLPLNTVSFGPLIENEYEFPASDDSLSESEGSSSSEDSSSSSESEDKDESASDRESRTSNKVVENIPIESAKVTSVVGEDESAGIEAIICKTCDGNLNKNKDGEFEVLVQCTKCSVANHPSCLELSLDMLPYIKKYNWQCTDCKNCIECNDPADEDKMLFCDLCDRGYHIYCVGLRKVPTGRWHCRVCALCYSCGVQKPSADDRTADWHHEFKKGEKGSSLKLYTHSLCVNCHKQHKKGQSCPICLKSHVKIDEKVQVECRTCEKWFHRECVKRPLQTMFGFMCDPCDTIFRSKANITV